LKLAEEQSEIDTAQEEDVDKKKKRRLKAKKLYSSSEEEQVHSDAVRRNIAAIQKALPVSKFVSDNAKQVSETTFSCSSSSYHTPTVPCTLGTPRTSSQPNQQHQGTYF